MADKEARARIKINKLLEAAGWRFFADGKDPANIQLEPSVTIKSADIDALGENFEKTTKGFIDFLLLDAKAFPLIVLEAKAEDKNPLVGKEQARKYARSQNCRFVILSNGNLHYFWDLERGNPYIITSFPKPESVTGYQKTIPIHPAWPMVQVGEACIVNPRKSELADLDGATVVSFVPMSDIGENAMFFEPKETKRLDEVTASYTYFKDGDVLLAKVTPCFENGKAGIARDLSSGIGFGSSEFYVLRPTDAVLPQWVFMCVATPTFCAWATLQMTGTGGLQRVPRAVMESFQIPLPPLATQQAIVADIKAEQALVAANRELIARFEKKIQATLARVWGEEQG